MFTILWKCLIRSLAGGNHFLQIAVENKILQGNKNHLLRGFVFVDFSFCNLRVLADPQWIERLVRTNMNIVIITDRKLEALANYFSCSAVK